MQQYTVHGGVWHKRGDECYADRENQGQTQKRTGQNGLTQGRLQLSPRNLAGPACWRASARASASASKAKVTHNLRILTTQQVSLIWRVLFVLVCIPVFIFPSQKLRQENIACQRLPALVKPGFLSQQCIPFLDGLIFRQLSTFRFSLRG